MSAKPDSNSNNLVGTNPKAKNYLGKHPGTAFMELQFYGPGYVPQFTGFGCAARVYCAAMTIDSLTQTSNTGVNNTAACNNFVLGGGEPTNWAYVTKSGKSQAPANPLFTGTLSHPNFKAVNPDLAKDLLMRPGDRIRIHMHDTRAGFQVNLTDLSTRKSGSMTSEISWNDANDEPFLGEIRSVRVANIGPSNGAPVWQIDWTSTLTSRRGEIKLRGDRQHAGFQFRAAQEVAEKKSATYIRPKGFPQEPQPFEVDDRKNPDRHVNLGWFAMSYEVKGTRYTVAYFEDPALPKPSMFSERPYGRFGAYFKATVTPDKPLTMRYRLIVTSGMAPPRDAIQAQYDRFVTDLGRSLNRSEPK